MPLKTGIPVLQGGEDVKYRLRGYLWNTLEGKGLIPTWARWHQ